MAKCAADQVFFATQADGLFLAVCAILDSNDLPHAIHEVKLTFLTTWLNDCAVWPLVNFIGFWQVPTKLVPTYMASMQLIWQLYLSMAQQKAAPVEAAALAGNMTSTTASRDLNVSLRSRRSLSSKDLDQIFAQCDTDGSGGIDAGELRGALERCGIAASADDVKKMMKLGDLDGNGVVDRAEFKRLVQQKLSMENQVAVLWETVSLPKPKFTDTQLDNIFREFDRDGSGGIDARELQGALERCGITVSTDDVMKMMTFADLDGDSLVDRAEFTRLVHLTVDGKNQEAVLWKAAIARAVHLILQKGGIKGLSLSLYIYIYIYTLSVYVCVCV
jgi:Ca2+-binding EF-hand superfamily protein